MRMLVVLCLLCACAHGPDSEWDVPDMVQVDQRSSKPLPSYAPAPKCPPDEVRPFAVYSRYVPADQTYMGRLSRLRGKDCMGFVGLPGKDFALEAKFGPWTSAPEPSMQFVETHDPVSLQEAWLYRDGVLVSIFVIDRTRTDCEMAWYGKRLPWRGAAGTSFYCVALNNP